MTGLACTESGGRFDALNARSGSYGKYQIMPRNWVAWAGRYLGNRWAAPTPQNQEFVARARVSDLFEKHRNWHSVAHWWLTGSGESNQQLWSDRASGYVGKVLGTASRVAVLGLIDTVKRRCFPANLGDPAVRTEPWPKAIVTGGRVNVRSGPGYENRAIFGLRRGEQVAVLGHRDDLRGKRWLKVGLKDGRVGWLASWFVERR